MSTGSVTKPRLLPVKTLGTLGVVGAAGCGLGPLLLVPLVSWLPEASIISLLQFPE